MNWLYINMKKWFPVYLMIVCPGFHMTSDKCWPPPATPAEHSCGETMWALRGGAATARRYIMVAVGWWLMMIKNELANAWRILLLPLVVGPYQSCYTPKNPSNSYSRPRIFPQLLSGETTCTRVNLMAMKKIGRRHDHKIYTYSDSNGNNDDNSIPRFKGN